MQAATFIGPTLKLHCATHVVCLTEWQLVTNVGPRNAVVKEGTEELNKKRFVDYNEKTC